MKRILSISATLIITSFSYAQAQCNSDNALFRFDNAGTPREVHTLGSSPEFPFLRNLSSPQQVYAAIAKNEREHTHGMDHLNDMLMAIGFSNGAADVTAANISAYYVPPGTKGNMGSGDFSTGYYVLSGDASNFKAWKISSGTGCYMYIFSKCGNAFYPHSESKTACISAPVSLNGDMKEVTLNSSGQKVTTTDNVYIYCHEKRHRKIDETTIPEVADARHSKPLLLRSANDVETVPETYRVSLSTPDNTITVCPDSVVNLTANINVEKTSEYTGNYPARNRNQYKEVSKRAYRKTARKMRKVGRKENRIERMTGVAANV